MQVVEHIYYDKGRQERQNLPVLNQQSNLLRSRAIPSASVRVTSPVISSASGASQITHVLFPVAISVPSSAFPSRAPTSLYEFPQTLHVTKSLFAGTKPRIYLSKNE